MIPFVVDASDKSLKRPIKVIRSFITWVKHVSTDEGFPFPYVSSYITIAAKRLSEQWNEAKKNPETKAKFIEELKKDAKELRDRGHLQNPRGVDDDE